MTHFADKPAEIIDFGTDSILLNYLKVYAFEIILGLLPQQRDPNGRGGGGGKDTINYKNVSEM